MGKVFLRASVWQAGTIYLNLLQKKRVVKPDILFQVIKLWFVNRSFDFQDPMSVRCHPQSLALLSERDCLLEGLMEAILSQRTTESHRSKLPTLYDCLIIL